MRQIFFANDAQLQSYNEDNKTFSHTQKDDSSTSPSPNKLHKSTWWKMRDIITNIDKSHRESVKKKTTSNRGSKSSPDVVPKRRRSLSDGGDSDAPPALTLTIPSSEELGKFRTIFCRNMLVCCSKSVFLHVICMSIKPLRHKECGGRTKNAERKTRNCSFGRLVIIFLCS